MKRIFVFIGLFLTVFLVAYSQESSSEIVVQGNTLSRKFEWLLSNAESGKTYAIILDRDETIPNGINLDYDGRLITLKIRGRGAMRKISTSNPSVSLFTIRSGVTLILDTLITLHGIVNRDALIRVGIGATLIMNEGTSISGNTRGRGVEVAGGIFTMNGGTISGNELPERVVYDSVFFDGGGGVYIRDGGNFTMNGGSISGNKALWAGGICVDRGGTFILNNGTISGNNIYHNIGGIAVYGIFIMSGGSISGNTRDGVGVYDGGTFTMTGGSISGNIGAGVSVTNGGSFFLNSPATKSSISGNKGFDNNQIQVYVSAESIFRVNGLQENGY